MTIEMKRENMIDETKLDKTEAGYFINFLEEETERHIRAIDYCSYKMRLLNSIPVLVVAFQSSIVRHHEDITMIKVTIDYLIKKFGGK